MRYIRGFCNYFLGVDELGVRPSFLPFSLRPHGGRFRVARRGLFVSSGAARPDRAKEGAAHTGRRSLKPWGDAPALGRCKATSRQPAFVVARKRPHSPTPPLLHSPTSRTSRTLREAVTSLRGTAQAFLTQWGDKNYFYFSPLRANTNYGMIQLVKELTE